MAAPRLDYLVKSKNRCVVGYSSDGTVGTSYIDLSLTSGAWGPTDGEFATKALLAFLLRGQPHFYQPGLLLPCVANPDSALSLIM